MVFLLAGLSSIVIFGDLKRETLMVMLPGNTLSAEWRCDITVD